MFHTFFYRPPLPLLHRHFHRHFHRMHYHKYIHQTLSFERYLWFFHKDYILLLDYLALLVRIKYPHLHRYYNTHHIGYIFATDPLDTSPRCLVRRPSQAEICHSLYFCTMYIYFLLHLL